MEQSDLLRKLVKVLEDLHVPYFVTGSVATIVYGEPRFTHDINVVVALTPMHVKRFVESFDDAIYYVSEDAVRDAISRHSQFNIVQPGVGAKADVMIPDQSPFNESRFDRVRRVKPEPDLEVTFASPEDVIIKKMEYYQEGGSDKHLRDVAGVLRYCGASIDRTYIERWADRLGLRETWDAIVKRMPRASSGDQSTDAG